MEASRQFNVIPNVPDQTRINSVKAKLEAFFSGQAPSGAPEADFVELNGELFEACGCDLDRMVAEFNSCLGIHPDDPAELHLRIVEDQA